MSLKASELILNEDGSIYHLGLLPEEISSTVITVGDPARVSRISQHFDNIEVTRTKREFCTHTGTLNGKRITVMSTGMGTDNIDIALTELDALANINLEKKELNPDSKSLDIIRIGTTGSIRKEIPLDSYIVSELAMGFDGLMHYYNSEAFLENDFSEAFVEQTGWSSKKALPYVVSGGKDLLTKMSSEKTIPGFTATNVGFYGPQGRVLRNSIPVPEMNNKIAAFSFRDKQITNLEMETSGIYGMAKLMGHNAVSMNAVLANRATGEFSSDPKKLVDDLITYCLEKITT
ncbi:nucleoside phosphorylase [Christiangramia aquimixticola]|uniref:nucleoside phosphorylase n=1 Tax=Christiangramia aquimixticola TaxID=1697558 RepID=UPI003AA80A58